MQRPLRRRLSLFLFIFTLVSPACASATYLPRLEIANPTEYNLLVDVRGDEADSAIALGIAPKQGEAVRELVVDVGNEWIFRYTYLDQIAGTTTVSREDLEGSNWRFEIPAEVGSRLAEKGVAPSY